MSTAPLPMPCVLGVVDDHREELRSWLCRYADNKHTSYPPPPELQHGRWMPDEHVFAANAEVAAIRWQHIDRACPGRGAEIAATLRAAGVHALAFMHEDGKVSREMVEVLGVECAEDLTGALRGHIYLVPHPSWTAATAAAIEEDVNREVLASHAGQAGEWEMCPQRLAFFDMRNPPEDSK